VSVDDQYPTNVSILIYPNNPSHHHHILQQPLDDIQVEVDERMIKSIGNNKISGKRGVWEKSGSLRDMFGEQ